MEIKKSVQPKSKAEGESSQLNPVMEEEEEMKSTKVRRKEWNTSN